MIMTERRKVEVVKLIIRFSGTCIQDGYTYSEGRMIFQSFAKFMKYLEDYGKIGEVPSDDECAEFLMQTVTEELKNL